MRVLIILLVLSLGAQAEVSAVVSDLQGKVEVRRGEAWEAARLLASLSQGAELRLGDAAQASLAFVEGGTRVNLIGPCRVRLEGGGVTLLEGPPQAVAAVTPQQRRGVPAPARVNLDRMAGVRRDLFRLLNDPVLRSPDATLRWVSDRDLDTVLVTVENDGTLERVVRTELSGDTDHLPVRLEPGATYLVELIGTQRGVPQPSARFTLRVLDEPASRQLELAETACRDAYASQPQDLSPLSTLLSVYLEHEQYSEALELTTRMLEIRPGDDTLVRLQAQLELVTPSPDPGSGSEAPR